MGRDSKARYLPHDWRKVEEYHESKFLGNERRIIEESLQKSFEVRNKVTWDSESVPNTAEASNPKRDGQNNGP